MLLQISVLQYSNYINNQIQILESDEVLSTLLLDEKNFVKIKALYKKLPQQFLLKNFNFFKKTEKKTEKKTISPSRY